MIWFVWIGDEPGWDRVFWVNDAWRLSEEPDVAWLGECAWTARHDNTGLGLR